MLKTRAEDYLVEPFKHATLIKKFNELEKKPVHAHAKARDNFGRPAALDDKGLENQGKEDKNASWFSKILSLFTG